MTEDKRGSLFGVHAAGVGGTMEGFGEYVDGAEDAGKPAIVQSVDNAGPVFEVQEKGHDRDVLVFRMTSKDGENLDRLPVDNATGCYTGDPIAIADQRWERIVHYWPPELDPTKVWTVTINEPSKEQCDYDYLGRFTLQQGQWALAHNRRYLALGWSAGTPEPSFWENQFMLEYLRLCEQHPDKLGVSLHEYSLRDASLQATYPSHIGRFQALHEVCDQHGIAHPTIIMGEFGWGENAMTAPDPMEQLAWAQSIYAPHLNIKGAAIWTLGSWHGSIVADIVAIMPGITQMAVNWPYDPSVIPPPVIIPPPIETPLQQIWHEGRALVCVNPNTEAALQRNIHEDGWNPTGKEGSTTIEGTEYIIQPADLWDEDRPRVYFVQKGDWNNVMFVEGDEPVSGNPITGLKLGRLFNENYRVTNPFNAPASYAGNHEGIDYSTGQMGSQVLCAYGGTVTLSRDTNTAYGNYIIVEHLRNDSIFYTWYCHLGSRHVSVGSNVAMGASVGTMGASGNADGAHLHFNLQAPGYGLSGYVVSDVVDPTPHVPILPPAPDTIDMGVYFTPENGSRSDLFMLKNNWGQNDERTQLQVDGGKSYVVKNQQYEERVVTSDKVVFTKDTSPGDNKYYTVESDTGWMPRHWQVGGVFTRTEWVRYFDKGNCQLISENGSNTDLVFAKLHETWTSQSGIVLNNVAELEWHVGSIVDERYFYAPYLGLVAWVKHSGMQSWISELIPLGSQENNVRETGCFS